MPVGMDEVHPFLAAVAACRAVKEVIGTRKCLVQQGNEVVLHGGLLCHVEAELAVHGFELVACFIHASILLQFRPAVKGITCDFFGISLVGLGRAQGIVPEVLDEHGINGADKDTGIGKPCGDRLIVSSRMLHADLRFPVKSPDVLDQGIDIGLGMGDVAGRHENNIARLADRDSALTFGNINTNSVHNGYSFEMY